MATTEPLALEGPSGTSGMIDALAYVDAMSPGEKQAAEALIDKEMQSMRRTGKRMDEYTKHLRPLSTFLEFKGHEILRNEMARIDKGQRHMQPLDMSATKLDTPRLNQQDDLSAWQACSSNAAAQLEHQHNRVTNLKLGTKHGGPVWKAHNAHTAALLKDCERRLRETAERITKVNQRRKLQQDKARGELDRYASEYARVLKKNVEIEVACRKLQEKIDATGPGDGEQRANGADHADGVPAVQSGAGAVADAAQNGRGDDLAAREGAEDMDAD